MLRTRIITAVIFGSLLVAAITHLPPLYLQLVFAALVAAGCWEWAHLAGFHTWVPRLSATLALFVPLPLLVYPLTNTLMSTVIRSDPHAIMQVDTFMAWLTILVICLFSLIWWLMIVALLYRYQNKIATRQRVQRWSRWVRFIAGWFTLIPGGTVILILAAGMPELLYWLIGLTVVADVAAYFAGKQFGRQKLADRISPGKSWQGVWGGLVGVVFFSLIFSLYYALSAVEVVFVVLSALILACLSVTGDLFESLMKRITAQKDSSTLLPGHGGMLDRIDSLTAVAPLFFLGVALFVMS